VRGRAGGVHDGHPTPHEVGQAAALRTRLDSRRPHAGRIHRRRRASERGGCLRADHSLTAGGLMRESPFGARKLPVAVLGATGAVGQAFVRLLASHPWFELAEVAASERSAGRTYAEATRWIGDDVIPARVAKLVVQPCDPKAVRAPIVFSALDSGVAGEVEAAFAKAGRAVLSNARNYRMEPDVPLVIAEVNPD